MEPFRLSEQPAPKIEKSEKDDSSDSKKKRERAARRLHLVESSRDKPESKDTPEKPEPKKDEPTSLAELFEVKATKSSAEVPGDSPEVVDDSGKLTKEGSQASVSVLAEKSLESTSTVEASENMTPEEKGEATGRAFLELAADSGDIEGSAAQIQSEIGVTDQEAAAVEKEIPSIPPKLELVEDDEPLELSEEAEPEEAAETDDAVRAENEDPADLNLEIPELDDEEDEVSPSASSGSAAPAAVPAGTSASGRGTVPPPPPPSGGSMPPFGPNLPPPGGPGGPLGSTSPNATPNSPRPQFAMSGNLNVPQPQEAIYDSGNPAVTALIGYLIGRRHGRKRAERRAAKEQRKYERKVKHQIEDIDWQLKAKEAQIRKLATEKARQEHDMYVIPRPRPSDKEQARKVADAEKILANPPRETEQPQSVERKIEGPSEQAVGRRVAPEAHQLHGPNAQERLGHMLVNAAELPLAAAISFENIKHEARPGP